MNRTLLLSIIIILIGGGVWWWLAQPSASPAITAGETSLKLSADLYPLYVNAAWEPSKPEVVTIGTSTYSGASITSISPMPTEDPGSVFTPFERYYDQKLKALGWKIDNYLAAGGHTGGQTGYRKANELVLVRFFINYLKVSSTSPSECPCDVTVSLFSAN